MARVLDVARINGMSPRELRSWIKRMNLFQDRRHSSYREIVISQLWTALEHQHVRRITGNSSI